jgi:hypothetical protein
VFALLNKKRVTMFEDEIIETDECGNPLQCPSTNTPLSLPPEANEDDDALLSDDALRQRYEALKPNIKWMEPAIVNGLFLPTKGDYVVIEMTAVVVRGRHWLHTRVFQLVDAPLSNGNLNLWDPIRKQYARSNWLDGLRHGFDFRRPPKGCNPETCIESYSRRKVAQPEEEVEPVNPRTAALNSLQTPAPLQKQVVVQQTGDGQKRGRGRPKGVKNRSNQEKLLLRDARAKELLMKREIRRLEKL